MNAHRGQRGQIFVIVGLALFLISAMIGLAADFGLLAFTQNQGQAAVDTAALAGASGLPSYITKGDVTEVESRIAALDHANVVRGESAGLGNGGAKIEFLIYDRETNRITCESGCDRQQVNAIRVTKTGYETPTFFGWSRPDAGTSTPPRNLRVSAVGHLGCPSEIDTEETPRLGPIALRECRIGFPNACTTSSILQSGSAGDNSAFTTFNLTGADTCKDIASGNPPADLQRKIRIGDTINLVGSGQVTSCLKELDDHYQHCTPLSCVNPPDPSCIVTLPVIDCASPQSSGVVVGFATACVRDIQSPSPKRIDAQVQCGAQTPSGPGGACFGTLAKRPILIR
jgi:Putative Flp pilus-assembly TadE/G-like